MSPDDTDNADTSSPFDRKGGDVKEELFLPETSVADFTMNSGLDAVDSTEEIVRVSHPEAFGSADTMIPDVKGSVVFNSQKEDEIVEDAGEGAMENPPISSIAVWKGNDVPKVDIIPLKTELKKIASTVGDYDSMLFEFDRFAYKGGGETVGYGYAIGDMVWGKVKSHPWWPGQIFNEVFASPTVRRTKREGHVLVAFFGDNSYGWFDPAELIPFAESFLEKSRQFSSRAFVKAVEEAVDDLSRRKCLGLACRCRNKFNFWPFSVEGYFTVHSGGYEPSVYSLSQIHRAREEFRPKEMLSFVQQLALRPKTKDHGTIEFFKSKATVLACRKAFYEEFDDTYAQAFGSTPERPARPTAPVTVDPSGVSLSGRLVFAEELGMRKLYKTPGQMKDELEKEKYLFKRRDEPIIMKPKKTSAQITRPLLVDYRVQQQTSVSGRNASPTQPRSDDAYFAFGDMGSRKLLDSGKKKFKSLKQNALEKNAFLNEKIMKRKNEAGSQEPSSDSSAPRLALLKKKRKKEDGRIPYPQLAKTNIGIDKQQVPRMLHDDPVKGSNNQQKYVVMPSSLSMAVPQQDIEVRNLKLSLLVRDLRALALNPFHGMDRGCPHFSLKVFLKYRSIVYQKSLVLSHPSERETNESHLNTLPALKSREKSSIKLVRPSMRPNDPTRGGKKRIQSDWHELSKKRKLDDSKDVYLHPKKLSDMVDENKKKMVNAVERKIHQKPATVQKRDVKEVAPSKLLKSSKLDSSTSEKLVKVRHRTALMMKFPKGASLPSGAELAAKFARFGPVEFNATRIYWEAETCRLIFLHKADAEAALKFAASSENLFGYDNVFYHLKDASIKTVKTQKEDTPSSAVAQLKSCLKSEISGNSKGTRVKFVCVGSEQNSITATTTHSNSMDFSTKSVAKLNPEVAVVTTKPSMASADISGELLRLLNRCKDVVSNVAGALGYEPYHSL